MQRFAVVLGLALALRLPVLALRLDPAPAFALAPWVPRVFPAPA